MKNKIVTAITLEEEPHVIYNRSCIAKLPKSGSTHFEVTNCISGWLVDLFHVLEDHCNFKLKAFASHKNIPYGDVVKMENGEHHLSGLFAEGINFDMILGASCITEERVEVMNFLYPLVETRKAIFIKNDLDHQNQWFIYFEIFTLEVWIAILAIAILPTVISAIHDTMITNELEIGLIAMTRKFVASFAFYFGGNFLDKRNRGLVLICHLSYGILIWIFFRGSLTSKLTERSYKNPFNSMEELSTTPYYLLTARNNTRIVNHFLHGFRNTSREQVFSNNMDNNSFIGLEIATKKLLEEPYTAMYYYEMEASHYLSKMKQFCKTLIPWKNHVKLLYSVAFNKNFANFESLNMVAKRMKESGLVQDIFFRHNIVPRKCEEEIEVTVGYEKVFPLFFILLSAMCGSVLYMFILECLWPKK